MKHGRLGPLAVLAAAVVLAVPAVAQAANEVTKWNGIAVATVNGQPGITSAPPAGSIFVAMVQGAVYGAVNAVDRHGRPYLVNRASPRRRRTLQPLPRRSACSTRCSQRRTRDAATAYEASLARFRTGKGRSRALRSERRRPRRCSPRATTAAL